MGEVPWTAGRGAYPMLAGRYIERCPACGSGCHGTTGKEADEFEARIGDRLFVQAAYTVRACGDCGLYFKTPTPSLDELTAYYAMLDPATFESKELFPTDCLALRMLSCLPQGSRILDYGCGAGRILGQLTERYECVGVEVNAQAARQASARGIRVCKEGDALSSNTARYGAILMSDVFEHLVSPVDALRCATNALAPGGLVIIVTGLADAVVPRELTAEHWYFRIFGHLQMLSDKHLNWLCRELSLELVAKRRCSHYVTTFGNRLRQHIKRACYLTFHSGNRRLLAGMLRRTPVLKRAEHWRCAPAFTCGADHVVVAMRKFG